MWILTAMATDLYFIVPTRFTFSSTMKKLQGIYSRKLLALINIDKLRTHKCNRIHEIVLYFLYMSRSVDIFAR